MPACQVCDVCVFWEQAAYLVAYWEVGTPNYLCLCSTYHNIGVFAAWTCRADLEHTRTQHTHTHTRVQLQKHTHRHTHTDTHTYTHTHTHRLLKEPQRVAGTYPSL